MKRLLIFTLLTFLAAGTAKCTYASITDSSTIIYETSPNQQIDFFSNDYDLTQYAISADFPLDNFKLGLDLTYSRLENDSTEEYQCYAYKLKGGVALIYTDQTRLDLTGGFFKSDYRDEDDFKITYESAIIGLDAKLALSDRVWFNANYMYGINPKISFSDDNDKQEMDQLYIANVRINFHFLEDTGLSMGYRWENFKNNSGLSNIKNSGYTIGLSYIF
jgi:hypothetical protein